MIDGGECHYCHITKAQISELIEKQQLFKKHITRGWTLEIDRKIPYLEYTEDNCVTCCYWCNNAKTDEFSYDEFKKIGIEIEKIWNERLDRK
jgi:5-methylcytosine-specific restriction endonuclease McrA